MTPGCIRVHIASITNSCAALACATRSAAAASEQVNAFSTSAGLPAASTAEVTRWCCACGVAT